MKKLVSFIVVCAMTVAFASACSFHSHTKTDEWTCDAKNHWQICDECGEKVNVGKHTLNDELMCTVCNSMVADFGDSFTVYTYDEHDNIVRTAEYDAENNLISENVNEHEYDSNGNLTHTKEYIEGELYSETEYTVGGGESSISKYTQYSDDGTKFVNEYDENGNVIKLIDYDADGSVNSTSESVYAQDSNGEWYEKSCTEMYKAGFKIESEYNEYGHNISRIIYNADGEITANDSWEYTYDGDGYFVTIKEYSFGKLVEESFYKMVTDGDETTNYPERVVSYNKDGGKTVFVYDKDGNTVSETRYDASGKEIE